MSDNWYIFPIVRQVVSKVATIAFILLLLCALLAVIELLLLLVGAVIPGLICGLGSEFVFALVLLTCSLLMAWSHRVLLAHGGMAITGFLCNSAAVLSAVMVLGGFCNLIAGGEAFINYPVLSFIICPLLLFVLLLNFNNMAALPLPLRLQLTLASILAVLVPVTSLPGLLIINTALKIALAACTAPLLRKLAKLVPYIISLPEPAPPITRRPSK